MAGCGADILVCHRLLPGRQECLPHFGCPMNHTSRRAWLASATAVGAAALVQPATAKAQAEPPRVRYSLNMSTIRGQKLSVPDQVDLAAKSGYDAIEPWMGELRQYQQGGGSLADLRKRIADQGLVVVSAIGFAEWIVNDDAKRAAGLETAKKDMDLIRSIGGTHIAAPPAGATRETNLNLLVAAERYRALLDLGVSMQVIPQLEVWGFSTTLSKLGETMLVATESKHPQACILLDVYHLYKGGSEFAGLRLLSGAAMNCFHMNDYPATPPRETIKDADRVYPGDGIAPLTQTLKDLFTTGFRGALSLELFNPTYWKDDPLNVARTGLEKMKAAVAKAIS
jgi:2-keto-myo-inositol isomerase